MGAPAASFKKRCQAICKIDTNQILTKPVFIYFKEVPRQGTPRRLPVSELEIILLIRDSAILL